MTVLYFLHCLTIGFIMAQPTGLPDNEVPSYDFPFVTRSEWNAREAKEVNTLSTPVPYVVIHHSYTPPACFNFEECANAMRAMQNYHMDDHGWWDIGYSFAVGSDGTVYEGRGWNILGAHSLYFNTVSIGICLIGDWTESLPPLKQLKAAQDLILTGVKLGYIKTDYKLVGHGQVRNTECPGKELRKEIQSWHHHSNFPATPLDLLLVPEIPDSVKDQIRNATSKT